jgi:two-component system sensor histidine kinase YesM
LEVNMKSFFRALSIKTKMFLTYASAYVVVITIIGVAIYVSNVNQMKNQTQSLSKVLSTQFSRTIDLYFQDIERLSLAIFTDSYIQETLASYEEQSLYEDIGIRNSLYPRLFNQVYPRPDIEGITLYTNTGTAFYYDQSGDMEVRYESDEKEWMKSLDKLSKSSFALLPTRKVTLVDGEKELIVSLVRHIYEIPQREKIGSLKIDISIEVFEKLLELENVEELEEHLRVLILTEHQSVVYDLAKELIGQQQKGLGIPTVKEDEPEDGTLAWRSKSYLYANDHSDFTNWDTVILIDNEFLIYERNQIMLFIGISGLIAIAIIAIISYTLSYNISKPFMKLIKRMKRVEKGDLTDRMELTGNAEIDVLTRVYNSMLDSINKLITEVYESSITEKNAKISALQSQINPHFLYNTLNVMKSISRVKGIEEVAEISESLSDLFKYSMKDLDKKVPLQEELNHIHNYMRIQQHRFLDRFGLKESVAYEAKQALIPKLLIQPLVENAIVHGLAYKKNGGIIQLHVYEQEGQLIVEVKDNGVGMSEELMVKIKEKLRHRIVDTKNEGVGLHNIAQRIRLMYGYRYGLEIESRVNEGTTMRIVIPFQLDNLE